MKLVKYFLALFLIVFIVWALIPAAIELQRNRLSKPGQKALNNPFHQELFIADMHADSLLWNRDLERRAFRGHSDFPRMREGSVDLQFFTVVTKSPRNMNSQKTAADSDNITILSVFQFWPWKTWNSLFERAVYQANKLKRNIERDGNVFLIKNQQDLQSFLKYKKKKPDAIAALLGLEGAHAIEKDLEKNFRQLYRIGYRMMAPTHFFDNEIAGSMHGLKKRGLTKKGVRFVELANEYNILLDLAHASTETIEDVLRLSDKPLVVSHTGLRGHCNNNRNIPDHLAKAIRQKGGLIGIGFWPAAVCGSNTKDIARAILYAIEVLGEDSVALGSDFDGSVTLPFAVNHLQELTEALLASGLKKASIKKIMGENLKSFLLKNLPKERDQ